MLNYFGYHTGIFSVLFFEILIKIVNFYFFISGTCPFTIE